MARTMRSPGVTVRNWEPGTDGDPRRWLTLAVLCLSLLVIIVDNSILNVALPHLQHVLDATFSQLQWMVDSYTLVFAGLLLTAGSLGDRFGRRGALQLGMAIFGLGSIASALIDTPNELVATRPLVFVIGRAQSLKADRNIVADLPPGDPLDDATVLLVGRGRHHATLSVAVGERMGVMGALSIDAAARCLTAHPSNGSRAPAKRARVPSICPRTSGPVMVARAFRMG